MAHIRPQATVDAALLLSDMGISDSEIADTCGVSVKTVRRWRRLYQRRGLPRGGTNRSGMCPRCDRRPLDEVAYAKLLGWYLGDGHIVAYKRGLYLLTLFNDARYTQLNHEILSTIRLVKPNGHPFSRQREGLVTTGCYWKHWLCLFPQHGTGKKHARPIILQDWQTVIVKSHPGDLVRGLFHSDGCRIDNWTEKFVAGQRRRYTYPRYLFKNESSDIMGLCQWALLLLGVHWTMPNYNTLSVARKADVAVLDLHIGPKR